jgi:Arc/MetJ-type ribon-helix-helix transcriptional regulator
MSSSVETVNIAVPARIAAVAQRAVEAGEYASVSEVVSEALIGWSRERVPHANSIEDLRKAWTQAVENRGPGLPHEKLMDGLLEKYQRLAAAKGAPK